jgi:chemotaxis protein CheD
MFQNKKIVVIYSGDYYISNDPDVVICTVLGSCIAVCLYDETSRIGGMNHFMLPRAWEQRVSESGNFGLESMEIMLAKLYKMGATHANIKAKVFGGARMLELSLGPGAADREKDVPTANINFILDYLRQKQIAIVAHDLGGVAGRKIYFVLENNKVYLHRL